MKVKDFLDNKSTNKHVRIISADSKKNCGRWYENGNSNKVVKSIKATKNILFLFV